MKKTIKKISYILSIIVISISIEVTNKEIYKETSEISNISIENIEALADSENSNCYFQSVYINPYTGLCYCVGAGNLCCEC